MLISHLWKYVCSLTDKKRPQIHDTTNVVEEIPTSVCEEKVLNFGLDGMIEIIPKEYKIGDVGGVPNDGIEERSIRVHQQAPDSGCRPDSAAWVMCGVTTANPLGSQSRGRLDDVLGRAWFPHMPE